MKVFLAISALCILGIRGEPQPTSRCSTCPSSYTEFQGNCYLKISGNFMGTHKERVSPCILGGQLATIPNKETNDFLMTLPSLCEPIHFVAIGLRCPNVTVNGDTSSCKWDDGTPFTYNNFKTGEPTTVVTSNDCAYAYMNGSVWESGSSCYYGVSCGICQVPAR